MSLSRAQSSSKDNNDPIQPWELMVRTNADINNTNGLSNSISTTKYSLITWLPKSLWEQFRRVANVYFIVISIMMLIGYYAPTIYLTPLNPYSTLGTLAFVLLVTSCKEGSEDLQRHRSDKIENSRHVTIITFDDNGSVVEEVKETKDVKAGDIIKLVGQMPVPVDMLLILTSLHADGNQCYVETANIDGETNLKLKEAPAALKPLVQGGAPTPALFKGRVEFEPPNKSIYTFIGALHLDALPGAISLSADNLLLRSSLFSNTEWAYGVAVYTGQETKIQMNNRHAPSKMSKLEEYANKAILIVFTAQVVLVSISVGSIYMLGFDNYDQRLPYVYPHNAGSSSVLPLWLEQWFVFFLLFNNFIPISLYVTIELVNVGQAWLVGSDELMYDAALDMPCTVRSSNLVQELGQISNVFSDKTGTLTRNEMRFVKFVIDGVTYDIDAPPSGTGSHGKGAQKVSSPALDIIHEGGTRSASIINFLRCLTTCHTVIREKDGTYRSESPDELALIEGVSVFNCRLQERGTSLMNVEMLGEKQAFEILAVNAFNADRKRMSILVREVATDQYYLMCKGADNIMLPLCSLRSDVLRSCEKSLLDLACLGLRTLCIAHKRLDKATALKWLAEWRAAGSSMTDRAGQMAAVAAAIEVDMELLGITAIEDRLQDEVPEVIADLAAAGIVLWMLTGDKEETAINIGHSCNLLLSNTKSFFLTRIDSAEEYNSRLHEVYENIMHNVEPGRGYIERGSVIDIALIMDGPSFKFFREDSAEHRLWLLTIGKACRSVIACRLTPIQKQQLVGLVKTDSVPKAITLAIGDGANDVSMIREADVGVGIFGKEGRQAANNADFAIGQFKFLRRLLLVHGRWNYIRQSHAFLYCLHKNIVLTLTLFWYSYYAAMSGTSLYESWVYTGFNFILGLPIIFYGFMDRDLSADFVINTPRTYSTGRNNVCLNIAAIAKWIFNAIVYSVVICLVYYLAMTTIFAQFGLYEMGTTVFVGMCTALTGKVMYLYHQWAYPQVFFIVLSIGGMFAWLIVVSDFFSDYSYVAQWLYGQGIFWFFGFFSLPLIAVLIDVVGYNLYFFFSPTMEMLYREMELQRTFSSGRVDPQVRIDRNSDMEIPSFQNKQYPPSQI